MLSRGPAFAEDSETLLVARQDDTIVFLSPTQDGGAPLRRSLPIERADLAEVSAVLSPGRFVSLDNYRGVPVLQVSRRIRGLVSAGEPWVLVQGVNAKDALSTANERRRFLLATLSLILFSIAALSVAAWRHGSSVRARHQAEELRSKAAKLQKQTDLLHTVTDNIDVLTVLMNRDQEVVFTNQATANAANEHDHRHGRQPDQRDLRRQYGCRDRHAQRRSAPAAYSGAARHCSCSSVPRWAVTRPASYLSSGSVSDGSWSCWC